MENNYNKQSPFTRNIASSQAKYQIVRKNDSKNSQGSYNLSLSLENYLINKNAIIKDIQLSNEREIYYNLSENVKLKLQSGIIDIIGSEYDVDNNKILFVHSEASDGTKKFQVKRTNHLLEEKLIWFSKLFDNNFEGAEFRIYYEESEKTIYIDNVIKLSKVINDLEDIEHDEIANNIAKTTCEKNGFNMIYYGTPGCGKSYIVNKEYCSNENNVIRTTFHPEYSNSDFIGQILPKIDEEGNVIYSFQEGPFSLAILKALKNPQEKIYLIIEEINRGNASSIFGDMFQLLDRDSDGKSVYKINNHFVEKFLKDNGISIDKIYIPSNLWIIATMNTSDQNVFTLDTAFKRRWRMNRISNKFTEDNVLAEMKIPGSHYTWKEFVNVINAEILNRNPVGLNGEDKQIGVYFVSDKELLNSNTDDPKKAAEFFAEKVLMYIWEDIAKVDPSLWFDSNCKSFEDLLLEFNKKHLKVFKGLFMDDNEENSTIFEENMDRNE